MKVSVVLATYNGERYILEQLQSIYCQSIPVDEVIICDDMSSDNSVEIIKEFITENDLSNQWRLLENSINKGYIQNFIDGLKLITGDVVFFSDQDDLWDNNKVEHMLNVITNYDAEAVFCLDDYIGSQGEKIRNSIGYFNRIKTNKKVLQISLSSRLRYGRSPGLCICFRDNLIPQIIHVCENYALPHDLPVGLIAAAHNKYYYLNEVLVHHRLHNENVSAPLTGFSKSLDNKERQVKSRMIKQEEFRVINDCYAKYLNIFEKIKIRHSLLINHLLIDYLDNKKIVRFTITSLFTNRYFNKLLLLRNILYLLTTRT